MFTYTDSLTYEIKSKDVYQELFKYCIVSENGEEVNIAKGVNILIKFKEYKNILFSKKLTRHKMKRNQSKLHKIGAYDICKISLPCFDEKRYILNDGITILVFFQKDLKG